MNQHDLIYILRTEMLDKQLTQNETVQPVTQLPVMDVNWLGIKKNTDHYKIKIVRTLHLLNYTRTETKLLESC